MASAPITNDFPPTAVPQGTLWRLFTTYRWRILFTYALLTIENLLRLAQPLVLGLAINDLIRSSPRGLFVFLAQHLAHMAIGTLRQMFDTRAFSGIYTDLATGLVQQQRNRHVETSRVAARSALARQFVDFFERHVPMAVEGVYSVIGALVLLAWYDPWLAPYCLALLVPACLLNAFYGRRTLYLSGQLHDQLEREVDVIDRSRPEGVRRHFRSLARWRIRLSDSEAVNFALMELFVMGLIAASLVHYCLGRQVLAGDVFAVFRYVLLFVMGLDKLPLLVAQLSRVRDVSRRVEVEEA